LPDVNLRTILIPVLVAGVAAAGCQEGPEADGGRISVVASFYPLQFVAERLGGDCVSVTNLTPPGVEPHDLELSPDAVESIVTADLVLYLGGGFQPAVEEALPDAEGEPVDGLAVVETEPAEGEAVDEGLTVDPHIWLDPTRFAEIVGAAAAGLEAAGVAASCDVPAAADALRADLADLDEEFRIGLRGCDRDLIVTNHAAFGYLASAYGLRQEAIAGLEPDVEPSAKRIADLKDLVEREGVTTILTEELVSPDVAQTLAAETGANTAVLFTIEGLSDEEVAAGEDYRSLMQRNLETLRVALGCT
jgi:zinc transport system substrate-binding protein